MNYKNLRHEFRLAYLSFAKYRRGFLYLYMRFIVGPGIIRHPRPLSRPATVDDASAHFLTGARDFTMALWALASFYRYSTFIPKFYFHTDGTLTKKHRAIVERLFPDAVFIDGATVGDIYADELQKNPALNKFRKQFPGFQSKKLVDTFLVAPFAYRFVLDSDMLWFKDPLELADAYRTKSSIMMDGGGGLCPQRFTDGTETDEFISGLNSGIVGFSKEAFSMVHLDEYLGRIDLSYTQHFVEQAGFALCLRDVTPLPPSRYIIKGTLTPEVVMRHYTSPSRAKFFLHGLNFIWKDILRFTRPNF